MKHNNGTICYLLQRLWGNRHLWVRYKNGYIYTNVLEIQDIWEMLSDRVDLGMFRGKIVVQFLSICGIQHNIGTYLG